MTVRKRISNRHARLLPRMDVALNRTPEHRLCPICGQRNHCIDLRGQASGYVRHLSKRHQVTRTLTRLKAKLPPSVQVGERTVQGEMVYMLVFIDPAGTRWHAPFGTPLPESGKPLPPAWLAQS